MVTEHQREQIEREETLRNDLDVKRQQEQQSNTMHGRAVAEASLDLGRFTAVNSATVVGSEPAVRYPAAAAHQADPCGTEPPLGFSVNDLEPSMAVPPVVEDGAPAGATASLENLPPSQGEVSDAGAPSSIKDDDNAAA
jgi:hypothetical protein